MSRSTVLQRRDREEDDAVAAVGRGIMAMSIQDTSSTNVEDLEGGFRHPASSLAEGPQKQVPKGTRHRLRRSPSRSATKVSEPAPASTMTPRVPSPPPGPSPSTGRAFTSAPSASRQPTARLYEIDIELGLRINAVRLLNSLSERDGVIPLLKQERTWFMVALEEVTSLDVASEAIDAKRAAVDALRDELHHIRRRLTQFGDDDEDTFDTCKKSSTHLSSHA